MDRKNKILSLMLSTAVVFFWACGEGEIVNVEDADEMVEKKITEKSDVEFLETFLAYCKGKKGCEAELVSSSSVSNSSSSVKTTSSSSKSNSSSSVKTTSSSSKSNSSSSVKTTSSSSKSNSSSSVKTTSSSSSSQAVIKVSGKCDIIKPSVVYVGDGVIWRYLPDEGTLDSADYVWNLNKEVQKNVVEGDVSGKGLPEIVAKFTTKGRKYGPILTFSGVDFDCANVDVVEKGFEPVSSSSAEFSSSSKIVEKSSSSSAPEVIGHCVASKTEIYVDETIELYVADSSGTVLEGRHNWLELGGGELVEGKIGLQTSGTTKIVVKYTQLGAPKPMVLFGKSQMIECTGADGEPLFVVKVKEESSSSVEDPEEESSSSSEVESSSSSKPKSSSSFGDVIIPF